MEREGRGNKWDKIKTIGTAIATGVVIYEASKFAFTKNIRREVLQRDSYTCQGVNGYPCAWELVDGEPASWRRGHFVMASHKDHTRNGHYNDPENGVCQCKACHMMYEKLLGQNQTAIQLLNKSTTMYHYSAEKKPYQYSGVNPEIRDVGDVLASLVQYQDDNDPDRREMANLASGVLSEIDFDKYEMAVNQRDNDRLSQLRMELAGV